ncbi:MAG TPA: copper chaperone PCu(A)C [Steroidobacteraceae bacterium]|nr:copper chaperone PCu(A)C [Steroidobacteraceae bacterium]
MTHFRRRLPKMGAVSCVCFVLIAAFVSRPALGGEQELTVSGAWMRFIMPSVPAAAYFRLSNKSGKPRVLIGGDSPACGMIMLHESVVQNGMDRMVMLKSIHVPAHGHVDFAPGHYHLMCTAPSKEVSPGHRVTISLRFADGERISARFTVRDATGT